MIFSSWKNLYGRAFVSIVGLMCTTEIIWQIYTKYKNCLNNNKVIREVFFFSENSSLCRVHLNCNRPCKKKDCPILSLQKVTLHLLSAEKTLDICVYFLTFPFIVREIIKLQKQNIFIRIITDDETRDNEPSQILNLRKAGIQIRTRKSVYLMHHKFAIIDKKILITGSANWTLQAFFGNCENLLITSQQDVVNAYNHEFENLWSRFNHSTNERDQIN